MGQDRDTNHLKASRSFWDFTLPSFGFSTATAVFGTPDGQFFPPWGWDGPPNLNNPKICLFFYHSLWTTSGACPAPQGCRWTRGCSRRCTPPSTGSSGSIRSSTSLWSPRSGSLVGPAPGASQPTCCENLLTHVESLSSHLPFCAVFLHQNQNQNSLENNGKIYVLIESKVCSSQGKPLCRDCVFNRQDDFVVFDHSLISAGAKVSPPKPLWYKHIRTIPSFAFICNLSLGY